MDNIDEELAAIFRENFPNSTISATCNDYSLYSTTIEPPQVRLEPPPVEQPTLNNFNYLKISSSPVILNFSRNNVREYNIDNAGSNPKEETVTNKTTRAGLQSQPSDHIIAERKRREQLSQLIGILCAIVPGLKKTDKTSVLGDTIMYLKTLQERVKILEVQTARHTIQSVVMVKKSQKRAAEEMENELAAPLLKIEAKVNNRSILLKILCEKNKGLLVKILGVVEKLNLEVVSTNAVPFGSVALDITIVVEMEKDFNVPVKDVVIAIRSALRDTS
ncbi:hypothetical protein ACJIZ3_014999 [Penstemon smallii]|uniref:BHLH domain-containing protein n=1 Tax=Penstemon smallii TaxID=265156 RepID=A0ABD3RSU7_9LAMI